MSNNFTRIPLADSFSVSNVITLFYMEILKDFQYAGEKHDFWELVYIDKGEMLCTAGKKQFVLKSGELTFHKPDEYHNLSGNGRSDAFVSILTFDLAGADTDFFEGKIFRLSAEQKATLSALFSEGISALRKENERDPLVHSMKIRDDAPFGHLQMIRNYLEIFLVMLRRSSDNLTKDSRRQFNVDGMVIPARVKQALDYMNAHVRERITVSELASHLGVSDSLLKKEFSTYYGGGVIGCFNRLKAEEAKRLIRHGKHSFSEIADLLDFDTPQYFSKFFKQQTNMTPSEYKHSII